MANDSEDSFIKSAALGVVGFAAAISIVHLGHGIILILALGMPPLTAFATWGLVMEFALALLVGLLVSPIYKAPKGEWIFPLLAALLFIVIERVVAVDPSKIAMWAAPAVVAVVFFYAGRGLYRVKPFLPAAMVAVLYSVLISLPIIADSTREKEPTNIKQGEAKANAPDVLMIVMDTVRSQSTSAYGYERKTTPVLDQLAAEGVLFEDANAPATWSLPAHAALFTGTFPSKNNAHAETRFLDGKLPTLAEWLVKEGWESRCFSANPHISPSFGLTRGFQHNDKAWMSGTSGRNFSFIYRVIDALGLGAVTDKGGATVIGNIDAWMSSRPKNDRPAFVFVNFLEAHFPFRQLPAEFREEYQHADMNTLREIDQIAFGVQFGRSLTKEETDFVHQPLIDLYDGGVKYTDHLVGEVLDIYRRAGRLDNTIVVVLADHGEIVGEHGAFGHVTPVLEQDLRVPLVIRYPKKIEAGKRISTPVSTVGTFATIVDLVDVPTSPMNQIQSLLSDLPDSELGKPIMAERFEEEMLASRFAAGTANGSGEQVNPRGRFQTYRSGDYKFVRHSEDGEFLFNLKEDPGEYKNVAEAEWGKADELKNELDEWRRKLGLPEIDAEVSSEERTVSKEECEALVKLGYMEPPCE